MPKLIKVSYFTSALNSKIPSDNHPLYSVLEKMKSGEDNLDQRIKELRKYVENGKKKLPEYDDLKKRLPAITVSDCFEEREKKIGVAIYSFLTILDIDGLSKQGTSISETQKRVMAVPETFAGFVSPGGDGYKIIVKIDTEAKHHEWATMQVMKYYQKELKLEIDPSGKDLTRLCFLSHDPNLIFNPKAKKFNISLELPMEEKIKKAESFTEKNVKFTEGGRNNFIYALGCNLNRFGVQKVDAIQFAQAKYSQADFADDEVESTIINAYRIEKEHGIWGDYDKKSDSFDSEKLVETEMKKLEVEMKLNELDFTELGIGKILLSILGEEEFNRLFELLRDETELYSEEISSDPSGEIVKEVSLNPDVEIDQLTNHQDHEIKEKAITLLSSKIKIEDYHIFALQITVLRFKVSKIKSAYDKLAKSFIHQPFSSILQQQGKLDTLLGSHNKWVGQIKSLFMLFKEGQI